MIRTSAGTPASGARSASASCGVAVPSQVAPASTAARAHAAAPCPYPSALTTAMRAAPGARSRRVRALARTAARSISARARRRAVRWAAVSFIPPSVSERYDAPGPPGACPTAAARAVPTGPEPGPRPSLRPRTPGSRTRPTEPRGPTTAPQGAPPRPARRPVGPAPHPRTTSRQAAAISSATSWAPAGAPSAAKRPARPCRYAAALLPRPRSTGPPPAVTPRDPTARPRSPPWPATTFSVGFTRTGLAARVGDQRRRALEQHGRPVPRRQLPHRGQPAALDLAPFDAEQRGGLPGVRGHQGRRRARPYRRGVRQPQPVRVDQHRYVRRQHLRDGRRVVPAPGPTTQDCTRPACSGPLVRQPASRKRAITACPAGPTYRTAPRTAAQRPRHREHRGPRITGGPGRDADDAPPCTCRSRRPAPAATRS
ncbi:hypothetical protein SGRIM128S_05014 [Streptomyces griseomycini]